ncbi:superoxide reductase [Endomicrobiia bacterium]|nr:superoxide reductase [Endomicrobiia bacterium]
MKGLVCKVCGYVALDGSKDQCPICLAENEFEEKEDAYKMPDFKAISGETEKKHIPYFTIVKECGIICGIGCIDVHVKIGEILHPSLPEHHIAEVTFYVDNKFVSNVMFTSNVNPATVIHLKDGTKGKVQAIENCNIHGKWYNEVEIK